MRNRHILSPRTRLSIVAIAVAINSSPADARRWSTQNQFPQRAVPTAGALDLRQVQTLDALEKLSVSFVENRGQTDARVRYYAQGPRYAFYATRQAVILSFVKEEATAGLALELRFVHSNPSSMPEGARRAPGEVNYFRGADPADWQTELARFERVMYRELWPGVDLQLYEQSGVLKYEFRVRPGGRPEDIRLAYSGADGLTLDVSGALLIKTAMGVLRDSPPVSYQEIDGARVPVKSHYVLQHENESGFGFNVDGGYQRDYDLIVDPGIAYSTLIGGSSHEMGAGIAVDGTGNAYVVGTTQSPDFPTTAGAFRRTGATSNVSDVFVTKLNANGTALVYSTFIGGSDFDFGRRIAIDASGNVYVTGQTKSSNFPTTGGAFDTTFNIPPNCPRCTVDNYDAFVTKLNASGSGLLYSTFLGGTDIDDTHGIAVDGAGNAYVIGETVSVDFPTTAGAFNRTNRGAYDVFVTKLNAGGTGLVYSTYLSGTQVDNGERVAVDAGGNAYVMGFTSSIDFPTTPGAFATAANGGFDVFVTKVNAAGSALVYSTYLGGQDFDGGGGLAIDTAGNAYISGGTASLNFPTTPGAFDTLPDGDDAFLTKLNATGSALVYSTVFSGTVNDGASAVRVDAAGNAWLTGTSSSPDFPVTVGAADRTFNGKADAFIAEFSPDGSTLVYSTFLGGAQSDSGADLALDSAGNVYVTGHTYSADFPATVGAFDTIFNGDPSIFWGDAFVTKLAIDTASSPPPAPTAQTATITVTATGRTGERITSSPVGINVATGSTGSASFEVGTAVTLTVSNGRSAIWSGACSSAGSKATSCTFTVTGAATVTANVQ